MSTLTHQRRPQVNTGQLRPIVRHYLVTLLPDHPSSFFPSEYDPIEVTLSYTEARAEEVHPTSDVAIAEAFKRAVKLERALHYTPDDREFACGPVKFTRQRLSTTVVSANRSKVAA